MPEPRTTDQRFWDKVDASGNCWLWLGSKKSHGYGQFCLRRPKNVLAHRYAYETLVGPIPQGLTIDHLCHNRACVNPAHMRAVTMAENTKNSRAVSALNAARTHCDNGHEFSEENTRIYRHTNYTKRVCRTCERAHQRAYRERRSLLRSA